MSSDWHLRVIRQALLNRPRPQISWQPFSCSSNPIHSAPTAVHADILCPELLRACSAQVQRLGSRNPNAAQQTTWLDAASELRTPIEQSIRALEQLVLPPADCAGAEWWTQALSPSGRADIALHWDKDETEAVRRKQFTHPALASVLYLSDAGGPTIILPVTAEPHQSSRPREWDVTAVFPRKNRFLTFQGNLLHGVAPDPRPVDGNRLTLLVNWWMHKPEEPSCSRAELDMSETLVSSSSRGAPRPVDVEERCLVGGERPLQMQLPGLAGGGGELRVDAWPEEGMEAGSYVRWLEPDHESTVAERIYDNQSSATYCLQQQASCI